MRISTSSDRRGFSSARNFAFFALAMVLLIVPVPESVLLFRPDFVALLLIYLCWHDSKKTGVFTAFVVGLLVDALTFGFLGLHALAKVVVAYCAIRLNRFASGSSPLISALLVLSILLCQSIVIGLVSLYTENGTVSLALWVSPIVGAVLWLIIAFVSTTVKPIRNVPIK
ncbi:MAG: rod shape-determining protein MreD [Gammaproteobacteria bacterium]|nr:rod shape-determining protein MreD [Gammaproteobacteria bacterium]MYI88717.1 rod shape-determining protein MreD [Gammaproteobacteria bacterium]